MTIQEAIRSGRPFKRKGWEGYYESDGYKLLIRGYIPLDNYELKPVVEDLLAEDWVLEEEPVLVTRSQAAEALVAYQENGLLDLDEALKMMGFTS